MRRRLTVFVTVVAIMVCGHAFAQEELHSWVANALKKIPPALEKADKLVAAGDLPNAKVYLEIAQREWDMIHKDFKDKFDVNHPEIVAVGKQLDAVTAKVEGVAEPKEEAIAVPATSGAPTVSDALPSTMISEMKQFYSSLDGIMESVEAMDVRNATNAMERTQVGWDTKKEWDQGKFNPQHPDVLALDARFAEVSAAVAARASEWDDAAADLPAVLGVLTENWERLYETFEEANSAIRNLGSLRDDFSQSRENALGKLLAKMDEVRILVERVNILLPDTLTAAQTFRAQYPDLAVLDKLPYEGIRLPGQRPSDLVKRIEGFPEEWLRAFTYVINASLDAAKSSIKEYGTDNLDQLQGSDEASKSWAADAAERWVLDYASVMLDIVSVLLPELPEAAQASLPELVAVRQGFINQAVALEANIAPVAKAVSVIRKQVVEAVTRRLEGARFPKTAHTGGEWTAAEKDIRTAWANIIKDKELVKVAIYSPWETRTEAQRLSLWSNDRWVLGTYRYIGANCLAKLDSGKYMVYRMMFRNTQKADGSWSPLERWSVGHVYEILAKNIDK